MVVIPGIAGLALLKAHVPVSSGVLELPVTVYVPPVMAQYWAAGVAKRSLANMAC